ncbi:AraC family transcriptional regulator [Granulicatella sp. zg-ZJ]|uniref:AraC family transcriptional regulator n=1 Tax=Granulicatella sp. zg-ZJ TaxID=2678504 RepID=UPI0013D26B22|nr:AraC family transcriptional regulator [Granulicatella sp. zg-ZJ]NEW62559.1 AraC family transcriptional regulator [Granulicatella sp. zg-ZJ]
MSNNATFHIFNNHSYVDLYPIQFGKEACESLHSFGPSIKQHYLFHYIISGKGTFFQTEKQKEYHLNAGQGFLIPPNTICSYEADKDDPWTYIWIELDGLKAEHYFKKAHLMDTEYIFTQPLPPTENDVYKEMEYIFQHYQLYSANIIAHVYLFMDALISLATNEVNVPEYTANDLYITEALQYIEQHYAENICIEDIAAHCHLNRSYFSRLFKENMNMTPQQFLIHYRLIRSCDLLKHTNDSIASIAEAVGYSNQFNFSAAFKKFFNQSPHSWKKDYVKSQQHMKKPFDSQ